jgi:pseudouridylate synthase
LGRIVELTGGESLAANVALVRANARFGAAIAAAYARTRD